MFSFHHVAETIGVVEIDEFDDGNEASTNLMDESENALLPFRATH